jgi:hypothetical protein
MAGSLTVEPGLVQLLVRVEELITAFSVAILVRIVPALLILHSLRNLIFRVGLDIVWARASRWLRFEEKSFGTEQALI